MAKNENFLELKKQLKNGNTGNLYLLYGEERFVKDTYCEILKKTVPEDDFSDFNRVFINGNDIAAADDAINSYPMMAEKKLICIKDSKIFKSADGETKDFWQEALKNIPDYALLIFDESDVDKRSVLYKAAAKYGLCVEFLYLPDFEVASWIVREAQKHGKKISKNNAELLAGMCDPGIENVKNELDKLINYCGEEILKSDIEKVVSKPMNVVVFEITDALMKKDADTALAVILRLRENKESAFNLLYLLSGAFDKMLLCKLMLGEGMSYDSIASRLKLPPFIAKKYIQSADGFSAEFLKERVCKTAEYDLAVKEGKTDDWSALLEYVFDCVR